MADSRAAERMRRYRERQRCGLRLIQVAIDDEVADELGRRELIDHPDVEQLVAGVLAAACVTRNVSALRRAIVSAVRDHMQEHQH